MRKRREDTERSGVERIRAEEGTEKRKRSEI